MKKGIVIKLSVLAVLAFCTVFQVPVSWGQVPPEMYPDTTFSVGVYLIDIATPKVVGYPPPGLIDTTVYITNPGVSGTYLCANIYVFSPDAQMISCCSCAVDQNALLTLSAFDDLTNIRSMRFIPRKGVFKIISSAPPCDATNPKPTPQLLAFGDIKGESTDRDHKDWVMYAPGQLPKVQLSSTELNRLKNLCGMLYSNGSNGQGICSCGR
jgi:hypothetical protein